MRKSLLLGVAAVLLSGCAAIPVSPQAASVELSNDKPTGVCNQLGEVVGSQGNWVSGNYTSNTNLMTGARNDLRNKASALGGNYVWVQNTSNSAAWGGNGTTNTLLVGIAYKCAK